jgi:uncharacterized alkaline shock family protein YloU
MDGTTTIKNEVLVKIAVGAAVEVSGVDQVGASSVGRTITRAFGGGRTSRSGVGVTPGQPGSGEAAFNMTISTQYGYSIPDVASEMRNAIAARIKDITGLTVRRVDIHVEDIKEPRGDGAGARISYLGGEAPAALKEEKTEYTEIPQT